MDLVNHGVETIDSGPDPDESDYGTAVHMPTSVVAPAVQGQWIVAAAIAGFRRDDIPGLGFVAAGRNEVVYSSLST